MRIPTPVVAGAIAVAISGTIASIAFAATATAPNGNSHSFDMKLNPSKLSKSKPTATSVRITGRTTTSTQLTPVPLPRETFDFPKAMTIDAKGMPVCDPASIQSSTTAEAKQKCGPAKVGYGKATAVLPLGTEALRVPSEVLVFNGPPKGGRPTVVLHSYATVPAPATMLLIGTYANYGKQGYGLRLDFKIPDLVGGIGTLAESETIFKRSFTYKGKRHNYVNAKCVGGKLKARGTFLFQDGQSVTIPVQHGCSVKG